ncbi:MAG: helix-turn-helix domain-containing protein [Bacteroidetes bacterium]|nr:helix-turn-helix domain-containing protein [Bacteroidota bacterium]
MKPSYNPSQEVNISKQAALILKTVLLLNKPFGAGYIARILMGDDTFGWKKEEHKQLETFAELSEVNFSLMDDIINYLVKENYLEITNDIYGTVDITAKGEEWISAPEPIIVAQSLLKKSWYQVQLTRVLKEIRTKTAENTLKQPHEIFTNFTLSQITDKMPQTEDELAQVTGAADLSPGLKLMILAEVSRMLEKKEEDDRSGIYRKAYSPSHRKVKELVEAGKNFSDIAQERELKPDTVIDYIFNLHHAEEIDLQTWIEQTVDSKDLYKGSEYFNQVSAPKLKDAHSILGLDYPVLRLCRYYAWRDNEAKLKYAS